jgi:hypothetical protein
MCDFLLVVYYIKGFSQKVYNRTENNLKINSYFYLFSFLIPYFWLLISMDANSIIGRNQWNKYKNTFLTHNKKVFNGMFLH